MDFNCLPKVDDTTDGKRLLRALYISYNSFGRLKMKFMERGCALDLKSFVYMDRGVSPGTELTAEFMSYCEARSANYNI